MLKQSPSRGLKSKGIKVRHVLQICVLLAVCFWLIYQVKHSQQKRKEFDAKDVKVVNNVQDSEILRLGRKDRPRVTEIGTGGDKHGVAGKEKDSEEEEEVKENKHEEEEEENKHEQDEQEREDGRIGERVEERGGGDDETDENELEKKEAEHEDGEEEVDEDKEKEDNEEDVEENHAENVEKEFPGKEEHFEVEENEDARKEDLRDLEEIQEVGTEDHSENDAASDDQDHDGENVDAHEAREEQYKADDASSEVAHHVQNIIPKTENVTMGHANDIFGKVDVGQDSEIKSSDNPADLEKTEVESREDSDGISNGIVIEQNKYDSNLTKSDGGELQNSMSAILLNNQAEMNRNSTYLDGEDPALSVGLQTVFNANASQNAIVESVPGVKDPNLLGNVLEDNNKPKLASDENNPSEVSGIPKKTENSFEAAQQEISEQ